MPHCVAVHVSICSSRAPKLYAAVIPIPRAEETEAHRGKLPGLRTHSATCPTLTARSHTRQGLRAFDFVCEPWPRIRKLHSNLPLPLSSCLTLASLLSRFSCHHRMWPAAGEGGNGPQWASCGSGNSPSLAGSCHLDRIGDLLQSQCVSCGFVIRTVWNASLFSCGLIDGTPCFQKVNLRKGFLEAP